nr:hypothetical protein CFP56_17085 [Quercus suber]
MICKILLEVRVVHGLGKLGFYPARNRPITDRVAIFPTHNRLVRGLGFTGRFFVGWALVLGEAENRWKPSKNAEKWRDFTRSVQNLVLDLAEVSLDPLIFLPNHVENRQIWCIFVGFDCFGHQNPSNQAEKLARKLESLPEFDGL